MGSACLVGGSALAQDEGYLILTSTQIKDGTAECAATCTTDADCGEDRCIDAFLDGAGQPATRICGQRRFNTSEKHFVMGGATGRSAPG